MRERSGVEGEKDTSHMHTTGPRLPRQPGSFTSWWAGASPDHADPSVRGM